MVIKVTFGGKDVSYPSWNGPSAEPCPTCGKMTGYGQGGYNNKMKKMISRSFCTNYKDKCDYYEDNMTDEEREQFLVQFKKDDKND